MSSLFDTDAVPYGPSVKTVFAEGNSRTFSFIAIAAAATLAVCAISLRQLLQYLHKIQPCTPRTLAIVLVVVPPLFAVSSMLGLISPRGNGLFQLIRTSAMVMATFAYFKLIFWHVGGVTAAVTKITADMGDVKDHWLTKIPILWPLRLCVPKVYMSGRLLSRCQRLVAQFFWVAPLGSIAKLWLILEKSIGQDRGIDAGVVAIQSFETISMLAALYGLFTIFFATRKILADFQPLAKLAVVYVTFIISTLQNSLIPVILANSDPPPIDAAQSESDVWHPLYRVQAWKDFVVCLEMVLLSLLLRKAFPYNDMFEYNLLKGTQLPTLELEADDYISHRVDAAANTLRAVSAVDPVRVAQQRRQASLASQRSEHTDWLGGLRRRFSREGSITRVNSTPQRPDIVITPAEQEEDPGVPLQFLRARTNSIRHIQSLSMLLDSPGETVTDQPIQLGGSSPNILSSSLGTPPSADNKYQHTDDDPVGIISFEDSPTCEGQHQDDPSTQFRPAALSRHNTRETSLTDLDDVADSVFGSITEDDGELQSGPGDVETGETTVFEDESVDLDRSVTPLPSQDDPDTSQQQGQQQGQEVGSPIHSSDQTPIGSPEPQHNRKPTARRSSQDDHAPTHPI
eukprot:m.112628 g.112628  ORF g.112628 m.112628 type:complete len:627 (+) comp15416_c0_seq4:308-2188(+)